MIFSGITAHAIERCEVWLDERYAREVTNEPDRRLANRAAKTLLGEALVPWLKTFTRRALDLTDAQIAERLERVTTRQPLIGPVPVNVIDDLAHLHRTKYLDGYSGMFRWLMHRERIRVGTLDDLLREDPAMAQTFEAKVDRYLAKFAEDSPIRRDLSSLRQSMFAELNGFEVITVERAKRWDDLLTPTLRRFGETFDASARDELYVVLGNVVANVDTRAASLGQSPRHRRAEVLFAATRDPSEPLKTDAAFVTARGALMPFGRYGPEFERARLRTTNILTWLAAETMADSGRELLRSAPTLFRSETARTRNERTSIRYDEGLIATLQEGIISLNQLISLVLGGGIEGLPSGDEALSHLLSPRRKGLVTDLTYRHAMGVVGPTSLLGYHYVDALAWNGRDLVLTETFKTHLAGERAAQRAQNAGQKRGPGMTGRGCPVGMDGGLEDLAHAYLHVFRAVRAMGPGKAD